MGRTLALTLALLLAGCGTRDPDDAGKMIVRIGNAAEPQDLDPHAVSGLTEHEVISSLLEGLVTMEPRTLEPLPGQAESWDISADGRVYTFHLRDGLQWSNGDPVTAADFIGSWRRMLLPSIAAEYAYIFYGVVGAEAFNKGELTDFAETGFKALDDRTVEITLINPTSYFLKLMLHHSWLPVHLPTIAKFDGLERKGTRWTRPENYVGNGPYLLREWETDQHIIAVPNPTYWDRAAVKADELHILPITNSDTEERMFRTGQIDVTYSIPLSKIDPYREEQPDALEVSPAFVSAYFRVNVNRSGLADPRVRRALGMAIDRDAIARQVWRGTKFPAHTFTPPGVDGFDPPAGWSDDVPAARALLAEAGYPDGVGLPPIEILYPTSDNGRAVCEALQQMWRRNLGIDVRLYNQEWKVYLDTMNSLDYDVCLGVWGGDYLDPMTFADTMASYSGNNRTGWANAEYDHLLDEVAREQDPAARFALFARMEEILAAEAPVLPLYHYAKTRLVSPAVRGFYPNALDLHPLKHVWLEE